MSEPFLSEIRIMSFGFAPKGWAQCNGQLIAINQSQALFSLIGTTYGGDGRTTFGLPDLRGRIPIHTGNGRIPGAKGGEPAHTLSSAEMPTHVHTLSAANANADNNDPSGAYLGAAAALYHAATNLTSLQPSTLANAGGSQPHENMQPYLALNFCIALQGIFPSQT